MSQKRIAVIAGDGIGQEVMPEGLRVMDAAARKFGIDLKFDHFDFSSNPFDAIDADLILITEKDAVKCLRREAIASDSRLWVVPVQAAIDGLLSKHLVEKLRGYPTA